ncbi:TolB-like 6-bladed beta-propeller domain-containing protein [Terrimonas sp. NA20]|uniref:TolB-like 6-bladed beta-propeller domain-containing protein n=1 Tax=Terrimonas ginsenosidimutans TaxID=2908004 RepID=A0ABS9KUP4_9BACT|nr:BF3164 family lipoprotein [Terrimonas ginsenosidimutans]MCG2616040.1 TolB-like 6-bladed beta-propeller domain-containing protein [Terrimonas ginsenosidimutans]
MKKPGDLLFLLVIPIVLYSCAAMRGNPVSRTDFTNLPEVNATEQKLLYTELGTPEAMRIYKDSLLLISNNLNRETHHVRVFDIGRRNAINNILPASSKKGGTLSFMSFDISDSLVWVFDVAKNGFIAANLDTILHGKKGVEWYSEYRITPQVFFYDAVLLNRSEGLLSGNYDTDEKLVRINFSDSTRNKKLLSYEKDSLIGSSRISKMSYESFMLLRPDKKKLALVTRYADQFELVDLESGTQKRISGPEGFSPQLVPFEDNTGVTVATIGQDSRYGFLRGCVTGKFIYLLFSGYNVRSPRRFYSNTIFVFDWDGHPVKRIRLKNDIIGLAVTSDDKILYTLNPQTKGVSFSVLGR